MLHTPSMSTTPTTPPPAEPIPSVPYGPDASTVAASDATTFADNVTADSVAKGVGRTVVKFGLRALVVLLIRAIFRALFGR